MIFSFIGGRHLLCGIFQRGIWIFINRRHGHPLQHGLPPWGVRRPSRRHGHPLQHGLPHDLPHDLPRDLPHDLPHDLPRDLPHDPPSGPLSGSSSMPPSGPGGSGPSYFIFSMSSSSKLSCSSLSDMTSSS